MQGGSLVELSAVSDRSAYQQAVQLLAQATISSGVAGTDLAGTANEYLARAQLAARRYRGGADVDRRGAGGRRNRQPSLPARSNPRGGGRRPKRRMRDYEWVMAWSELFAYPFRADAQDRLEALRG